MNQSKSKLIFFLLGLYLFLNLFFLDSYPFVHSDEAWLASLTRSIITEKNPAATEEFFRSTDRFPHAVKLLFHIFQAPFLMMDFSINTARLFSIIASVCVLYFLNLLIKQYISSSFIRIFTLLLILTDIQYIYISRFARQEIIIYLFAVIQLVIISSINKDNFRRVILSSSFLSGISIFIHPNSFIIFTGVIPYFAVTLLYKKYKISKILRNIAIFIFITIIFGAIALSVSLIMDKDFFNHYYNFGSSHGVGDSLFIKLLVFPRFLYKIYNQVQGTYYLPDVRVQFHLFAAALIIAFFLSFSIKNSKNRILPLVIFSAGIAAGIIIIGKYSPPSIFFLFPVLWILLGTEADILFNLRMGKVALPVEMKTGTEDNFKNKETAKTKNNIVFFPFILLISFSFLLFYQITKAYTEVNSWKDISYNEYSMEIAEYTGNSGKVLANINLAFSLDYGRLCSYSDLDQVIAKKLKFSDYIELNKIEYIIWTEELDIIVKERPVWNDLYGNIYSYYDDAVSFLDNKCTLVKDFRNKIYPVRIVDYMKKREYQVKIYKVHPG